MKNKFFNREFEPYGPKFAGCEKGMDIDMKLSEKIIALRKADRMTQEELAAICNVSRQSISKWEADIALPETEKNMYGMNAGN